MELRLVEIVIPDSHLERLAQVGTIDEVMGRWDDPIQEGLTTVRLLVPADQVETLLDDLQNRFGSLQDFRVVVVPVQAVLPRPEKKEEEPKPRNSGANRISREEIFNQVSSAASLNHVFVLQTLLATLVAAVGLARDDVAVVIGAMVIAPLLGPNVGLSLASTLGEYDLLKKSLASNLVGVCIALVASIAIGLVFHVDPNIPAIASRTQVDLGDIMLGLAAGTAGVLAFTTGVSTSLIGVMVAVALLPPTVVVGLLLGIGEWQLAGGATILLVTNITCLNLAGILTFFFKGLRPRTWWEAERARRARRVSLATWTILLLALAVLIWIANR